MLLLLRAAGSLLSVAWPSTGSQCIYILHYATTNCVCLAENIRNSHRQVIMSSQAPSQVKGESQVVKAEADPAYINLKVKQQVSLALRIINSAAPSHTAFQDGAITHFRIKRSTQMRKVTSPVLHFALSCLTPYCAAYGELLYARRD